MKKIETFKKFLKKEIPVIFASIGDHDKRGLKKAIPAIFAFIGNRAKKAINEEGLNWKSPDSIAVVGSRPAPPKYKSFDDSAIPLSQVKKKSDVAHSMDIFRHPDHRKIHELRGASLDHHYHGNDQVSHEKRNHQGLDDYSLSSSKMNKTLIDMHISGKDATNFKHQTAHHAKHDKFEQTHSSDIHRMIENIHSLDDHIKNAPVAPKDFHVYSGVGKGFDIAKLRKLGHKKIQLPAYTSTSIDPQVATSFMGEHKKNATHRISHMLRIKIPAGSNHGSYLGNTSSVASEKEFLIKRNAKLKFVGEPKVISAHASNEHHLNKISSHHIHIHDVEVQD